MVPVLCTCPSIKGLVRSKHLNHIYSTQPSSTTGWVASLGFAQGVTRISVWSNESPQTEGLFYSTAHTFYQMDPLSLSPEGVGTTLSLQAPTWRIPCAFIRGRTGDIHYSTS